MRSPEPVDTDSFRRDCVVRSCTEPARSGGKNCRAHHAATMRRYWTTVERVRANETPSAVRVALLRARRRGELVAGPCAACGERDRTVGIRVGPAAADVVWGCRGCRGAILRDRATQTAQSAAAASKEYVSEAAQARRRSAIDRLDDVAADVAAAIRAQAATLRPGIRLSSESPLYRQRLAQLAEAYFSHPDRS